MARTATTTTAPGPPHRIVPPRRLDFLDGLRGLAAVQVVALHYAAAFLPGLGTQEPGRAHYGWEVPLLKAPYFFLIDGTFSVFLFFAISGMVLTLAFARRPAALVPAVARRVVRLGLPMAASLAFAAGLLAVWPDAHGVAAVLSNSLWLGTVNNGEASAAEVLRQALSSGMVLGYREFSVLPEAVWGVLPADSIARALNPPLWTLHIEFWGSVLVAMLVALKQVAPRRMHAAALLAVAALLSRSPFLPFVVGHLFALAWDSGRWEPSRGSLLRRGFGAAALVAGVWACTNPSWPWVSRWLAVPGPFRVWTGDAYLQNLYAAVLFFGGTMLFPPLWRVLASRPVQALGRNSFALYLVHFPILATVGAAAFADVRSSVPYAGAVLIATVAGLVCTAVAAAAFTRLVDRPAMALSRRIGGPIGRRRIGQGLPTPP